MEKTIIQVTFRPNLGPHDIQFAYFQTREAAILFKEQMEKIDYLTSPTQETLAKFHIPFWLQVNHWKNDPKPHF